MDKFAVGTVVIFGIVFFGSFSAVVAQVEKPLENERKIERNRRPNLLSELDLTEEQIRSIRRINRENRPLQRSAQQRLREANERLDEAIYADNTDEIQVQSRVKDLQNAQVELIKTRSASELAVRRILSVQQLAKFRDLRRKFAENGESRPIRQARRLRNFNNRRFNNRQRQLPAPNN